MHLFAFKRYSYRRALVTNQELTPAAVRRFYCDRGFQELLLQEFKDSYAMAKIPKYWKDRLPRSPGVVWERANSRNPFYHDQPRGAFTIQLQDFGTVEKDPISPGP
jgi:hypothetical protein